MDWKRRAITYDKLDWVRAPDYLEAVLDACELRSSHRVLDVGCGTGQLTRLIAGRAWQVVGLDLSPEMIAQADGPQNVSLVVGDARDMKMFESESFDCIVARMVFHHITVGLHTAVSECYRLLVPGGRLVVAEGVPPHPSLRNWFASMMALKEDRLTFLPHDFMRLLYRFDEVALSTFVQKDMSLRNWLEYGGVPEEAKASIWEAHEALNEKQRRHYHLVAQDGDIRMDWTTCIAVGVK